MIAPDDFSADSSRTTPGPAGAGTPQGADGVAVRPEVVARGRELADDAGYPSHKTLRKVSRLILASSEWQVGAS